MVDTSTTVSTDGAPSGEVKAERVSLLPIEVAYLRDMDTEEEVLEWLYTHGHGPGTAIPAMEEWKRTLKGNRDADPASATNRPREEITGNRNILVTGKLVLDSGEEVDPSEVRVATDPGAFDRGAGETQFEEVKNEDGTVRSRPVPAKKEDAPQVSEARGKEIKDAVTRANVDKSKTSVSESVDSSLKTRSTPSQT